MMDSKIDKTDQDLVVSEDLSSDTTKSVTIDESPVENKSTLDLDLEDDPSQSNYTPEPLPYDPEEDREKVRSIVTYVLVAIIAFVAIASLVGLFFKWITPNDLKEYGTIIFSPVIAVIGTVFGFYFAGKSK